MRGYGPETFGELNADSYDANCEESMAVETRDSVATLAELAREYLLLDAPTTPLCKPDCAGLCPICGTNRNEETCDCKTDAIDPRMAKLKDLLDDE